MAPQTFTKPALSHQKLIDLLTARGLPLGSPDDISQARKALKTVGYYRLSGFMLPFQLGGVGNNRHKLRNGTTIQKILALYSFDTSLRQHLAIALEKIEVAFRTGICDHLSSMYGPHWALNPSSFKSGKHQDHIEVLAGAAEYDWVKNSPYIKQSGTHDFIGQYYTRYSNPKLPPGWMIRECATFRVWARIFPDLNTGDQKQICDTWKYPCGSRIDHAVLGNWAHSLSILRNRCAHHARITHRKFAFAPLKTTNATVAPYFGTNSSDLRTLLLITAILLKSIEESMWLRQLFILFDRHADLVDISGATGFLPAWQSDRLWSL